MRSPQSGLRTVDVARRAGYSVQQVRDLERDGVLPPVARTPSGYRSHTEAHVRAALAYRALAAGVGPVDARAIMRAAHRDPPSRLLALLDEAHAAWTAINDVPEGFGDRAAYEAAGRRFRESIADMRVASKPPREAAKEAGKTLIAMEMLERSAASAAETTATPADRTR